MTTRALEGCFFRCMVYYGLWVCLLSWALWFVGDLRGIGFGDVLGELWVAVRFGECGNVGNFGEGGSGEKTWDEKIFFWFGWSGLGTWGWAPFGGMVEGVQKGWRAL